jgi:hypothetical protein
MALAGPEARAEGDMAQPAAALVTLEQAPGWSVGVRYQFGNREFRNGAQVLDLDMQHALAGIGYSPVYFLHLRAEAGWNRADRMDADGQGGLEWAAGGTVSVLEYVWRRSPVVGKTQSFALDVDAAYRAGQSNFADDFDWKEYTVAPSVRYTLEHRGEYLFSPFAPTGVGLRAGVVYSHLRADYGPADLDGNRDFGFQAGVDLRFEDGWVTQLRGTWFAEGDRSYGLGLAYNF